ncbi:MAG: hypothetical protein ACTSPB_00075 [Candidatus Thorarchaeota archaeon]
MVRPDGSKGVVDDMINDLIDKDIICEVCWHEECTCVKEESRDGECEHLMVTRTEHSFEALRCDWCTMMYPLGSWDYYQLDVCGVIRTICSDCHKRLVYLSIEMQMKKRDG